MLDKFLPENDLVKTTGRMPTSARRALYAGGGEADCLKSKQSDISSACASLWFSVGSPKRDSQKRTRLMCECSFLEIYPDLAKGLSTKQPTREP